jgi:hypothetical protein
MYIVAASTVRVLRKMSADDQSMVLGVAGEAHPPRFEIQVEQP